MKIAWFTPFSKKSAIGKVGKTICECFAKQGEVTIFAPDSEDLIETPIDVQYISEDIIKNGVKGYDYCIYNMGNYYAFHGRIYEVLKRHPGIVIFHDQTMLDFWISYFNIVDGANAFERFTDFLQRYEGDLDRDECYAAFNGYRREEYPLLAPFLENAKGVFSHSQSFCDKLSTCYNGKIGYSYLPCDEIELPSEISEIHEIERLIEDAHKEGKKVCVSNGMVQETKLIDVIQDALLNNKTIQDNYLYLVIGSYDGKYGEKIAKNADSKLQGCMKMMGYQTYDVMVYALHNCDLCFNLRYPNTEVCSLSLFEQMKCEKPVVVLNGGIYGEVPDDTVIRMNRENLQEEIDSFLTDKKNVSELSVIGKRAKKFVDENCTAERYVKLLFEFFDGIEVKCKRAEIEDRILWKVAQEIKCIEKVDNLDISGIATNLGEMFGA